MTNTLRALRRRILTPDVSATSSVVRGFHVKNPATRQVLETVGGQFLHGYAIAAEAASPTEAESHLETIPARFRGFAYEGAAMCFAILDAMPFGGGRVETFLSGRGHGHRYMLHVGVGWAMARLPKFLWRRLTVTDPLLRWLVLDGYGFHQAYFHTGRYVHQRFREQRFGWPDDPGGYAVRAIDQGIGRAMWFVGGADPERVTSMIDGFPESRRPDLYSGTGLAASYAGGVDGAELRWLAERAGPYRPHLMQGAVFAATARVHAGLVVPHSELAARVLCDMTPQQAADLSERLMPGPADAGPLPAYEVWRQRIANAVVTAEREG